MNKKILLNIHAKKKYLYLLLIIFRHINGIELSVMKNEKSSMDSKNLFKFVTEKNSEFEENEYYNYLPNFKIERCFIVTRNLLTDFNNDEIEEAKNFVRNIKNVYNKNLVGFSFCEKNQDKIDLFLSKFKTLEIEEDVIFKIASFETSTNKIGSNYYKAPIEKKERNIYLLENENICIKNKENVECKMSEENLKIKYTLKKQNNIPYHFYRLKNMGNFLFNNLILDNLIFKIFKINYLIKKLYSYEYIFAGEGIEITMISSDYDDRCSTHSATMASLIIGEKNGYAKKSLLKIMADVECNGTILLSKLLMSLENLEKTDILFLPLYGPESKILDKVINRIALGSIVIVAGGNENDNSCNYSPKGSNVIKVGSVTKNGYISNFSNYGECLTVYTLGEEILGEKGTSYSGALFTGAASVFLSYKRNRSFTTLFNFIKNHSMKTKNMYIFKMPSIDLENNPNTNHFYSIWYIILILIIIFLIIFFILIFLIFDYLYFYFFGNKSNNFRNESTDTESEINRMIRDDIY